MSYYITKVLSISYEDALSKTREALKTEVFGVLTEIDVKATLKNNPGGFQEIYDFGRL